MVDMVSFPYNKKEKTMSKPIYNSDGVNINYDAKVIQKTDGRFLFKLQNDGLRNV